MTSLISFIILFSVIFNFGHSEKLNFTLECLESELSEKSNKTFIIDCEIPKLFNKTDEFEVLGINLDLTQVLRAEKSILMYFDGKNQSEFTEKLPKGKKSFN